MGAGSKLHVSLWISFGISTRTGPGLPEPAIAGILGKDRVLGCTIGWGATMGKPGESKLTSSPDALVFGLGAPYEEARHHIPVVKRILENMGTVNVEDM